MKNLYLILILVIASLSILNAQDCFPNRADIDLNLGNINYTNERYGFFQYHLFDNLSDESPEYKNLIFAQNIWISGITDAGSFRFAGATYQSLTNNYDFYPGPLDADGTTYPDQCNFWDRIFLVEKEDMDLAYNMIFDTNGNLKSNIDCANLPKSILEWPGLGNQNLVPFVPDHDMADYFDYNMDGIYNPCDGDLPALYTNGHLYNSPKEVLTSFPLYLTYMVLNDAGGPHRLTAGDPLRVELHNYTWGLLSNFNANSQTFSKHKVVNRGPDNYKEIRIGVWTDVDLGCAFDDYAGTYIAANMAFYYNEDSIDGNNEFNCSGGVSTYGDHPPMLGISILEGFKDVDSLGNLFDTKMTASIFTFNCGNLPDSLPCNPEDSDLQFYYIMKGLNTNGEPIEVNGESAKYMFNGNPSDSSANTMCKSNISNIDARSIFTSGGGTILSGASDELVVSYVTTFDGDYPCPDISPLLEVQNDAVKAYENNWKQIEAIDPPTLNYKRGPNTIDFELINDASSNNYNEGYSELLLDAPGSTDQYLYKFEGYKVYQVKSEYTSYLLLDNPNFSKLVYQSDVQNSIAKIDNFKPTFLSNGVKTYDSVNKVNGENKGISTKFQIDWDYFTDKPLRRDGEYFYIAIAYAHNDFQTFDPATGLGQQYPYLESVKYKPTLVLRSPDNEELAPQITRLHGMGNSNNLKVTDASLQEIINVSNNGRITYEINHGPFDVVILDKAKVKDGGKYQVEVSGVFNESNSECVFEIDETYITVTDLRTGTVYNNISPIAESGEYMIDDLGLVVYLYDVVEPGGDLSNLRTILGQSIEYKDENGPKWLDFIDNNHSDIRDVENLRVNALFSNDYSGVVLEEYTSKGNHFFIPLSLSIRSGVQTIASVSPALSTLVRLAVSSRDLQLQNLNNVDIVFTSDQSLWSRCIVVETANSEYESSAVGGNIDKSMFKAKSNASVDQNGLPDGQGNGLGWFPGYAIDVETGVRLNIFFGENTGLSNPLVPMKDNSICNDMVFNPSDEVYINDDPSLDPLLKAVLGGQHFMYVTRQKYDECKELYAEFSKSTIGFDKLGVITWSAIPVLTKGSSLRTLSDGLIPNDVKLSLRVNNKFSKQKIVEKLTRLRRCDVLTDNPLYEFEIKTNPNVNGNINVENRSVPWTTQSNINYFKLINQEERVEVILTDITGNVVKTCSVAPNQFLEIKEDDLPSRSSIMFVRVKSFTSKALKTYKLVVVR